MRYKIEVKPRAIKDLESISKDEARRIVARLNLLRNDLGGDVKRLTNYTPEYRMRAGSWRVLFEVEGEKVIIYRILHRKEAYR